jgi:hypothetical protein
MGRVLQVQELRWPPPLADRLRDKKSFDTATLVGHRFHCPKTGKLDTYDKKDMVLRY